MAQDRLKPSDEIRALAIRLNSHGLPAVHAYLERIPDPGGAFGYIKYAILSLPSPRARFSARTLWVQVLDHAENLAREAGE